MTYQPLSRDQLAARVARDIPEGSALPAASARSVASEIASRPTSGEICPLLFACSTLVPHASSYSNLNR